MPKSRKLFELADHLHRKHAKRLGLKAEPDAPGIWHKDVSDAVNESFRANLGVEWEQARVWMGQGYLPIDATVEDVRKYMTPERLAAEANKFSAKPGEIEGEQGYWKSMTPGRLAAEANKFSAKPGETEGGPPPASPPGDWMKFIRDPIEQAKALSKERHADQPAPKPSPSANVRAFRRLPKLDQERMLSLVSGSRLGKKFPAKAYVDYRQNMMARKKELKLGPEAFESIYDLSKNVGRSSGGVGPLLLPGMKEEAYSPFATAGQGALGWFANIGGVVGGQLKARERMAAQANLARLEAMQKAGIPYDPVSAYSGITASAADLARGKLPSLSGFRPVDELVEDARAAVKKMGPDQFLAGLHSAEEDLQKRLGKSFGENLWSDADDLQLGVKELIQIISNYKETGEEYEGVARAVRADYKKGEETGDVMFTGMLSGTLHMLTTNPIEQFRSRPLSTLLALLPVGRGIAKLGQLLPMSPRALRALAYAEKMQLKLDERAGKAVLHAGTYGTFVGPAAAAVVGAIGGPLLRRLPFGIRHLVPQEISKIAAKHMWVPAGVSRRWRALEKRLYEEEKAGGVPAEQRLYELTQDPNNLERALMEQSERGAAEVAAGRGVLKHPEPGAAPKVDVEVPTDKAAEALAKETPKKAPAKQPAVDKRVTAAEKKLESAKAKKAAYIEERRSTDAKKLKELEDVFSERKREFAKVRSEAGELPSKPVYRDMKLKELKKIAKSKGIKGYSKMRKKALVDALDEMSPFEPGDPRNTYRPDLRVREAAKALSAAKNQVAVLKGKMRNESWVGDGSKKFDLAIKKAEAELKAAKAAPKKVVAPELRVVEEVPKKVVSAQIKERIAAPKLDFGDKVPVESGAQPFVRYNRKKNLVTIDEVALDKAYNERRWRKPPAEGVDPIPDGVIRSKADYKELGRQHAFARAKNPYDPKWESKSQYLNRMNREAVSKVLRKRGERLVPVVDAFDSKAPLRWEPSSTSVRVSGMRRIEGGKRRVWRINKDGSLESMPVDAATKRARARAMYDIQSGKASPERVAAARRLLDETSSEYESTMPMQPRRESSVLGSPELSEMVDNMARVLDRAHRGIRKTNKKQLAAVFGEVLMDDSIGMLRGTSFRGHVVKTLSKKLGLNKKQHHALFDALDEQLLDISKGRFHPGRVQSAEFRLPGGKSVRLEDLVMETVLDLRKSGNSKIIDKARARAINSAAKGLAIKTSRAQYLAGPERELRGWGRGSSGGLMEKAKLAGIVIKKLDKGEALPEYIHADPRKVADQLRSKGYGKYADQVLERYRRIDYDFGDLVADAKDVFGDRIADWTRRGVEGKTIFGKQRASYDIWSTAEANKTMGAQMRFVRVTQEAAGFMSGFERMLKRNVVTRNLRSWVNNFTTNWMIQALSRADPMTPLKAFNALQDFRNFHAGKMKKGTSKYRAMQAFSELGVIGADPITGELGGVMSGRGTLDKASRAVRGLPGGQSLAGGVLSFRKFLDRVNAGYKAGDTMYRIEEAMHHWDRTGRILGKMDIGDESTFTLKHGTKRLKRTKGGWEIDGKKATELEVDRLRAEYSMEPTAAKFFDYDDLPPALKRWKSSHVGKVFGSSFMIWLYKSLDVPGYKKGLGSAILAGPPKITSTSKGVNALLAKEKLATAARRTLLINAGRSLLDEDRELASALAQHTVGDKKLMLTNLAANPALSTIRFFHSGDIGEMTKAGWNISQSMLMFAFGRPVSEREDPGYVKGKLKKLRRAQGSDPDDVQLRQMYGKYKAGEFASLDDIQKFTLSEGALWLQAAARQFRPSGGDWRDFSIDETIRNISNWKKTKHLRDLGMTSFGSSVADTMKKMSDGQIRSWTRHAADTLFGAGFKQSVRKEVVDKHRAAIARNLKESIGGLKEKQLKDIDEGVRNGKLTPEMAKKERKWVIDQAKLSWAVAKERQEYWKSKYEPWRSGGEEEFARKEREKAKERRLRPIKSKLRATALRGASKVFESQ
ncbi:MAG: hypothetical protein Unbinned400contig1002_16 [Prokaryotic dsDNA virus sp.]|nr:MAG: hypothetical protein Unbinned400contig1002_16 [Prokaryotic dsDNA virus sp.]